MMLLKKLASRLLCAFQIHHLFRYINRKKILVLAYHGVTNAKLSPSLWGQLEYGRFKEQLDYIRRFHKVIPIGHVTEYLSGNGDIPDNSVVITFDDGYRNNYQLAYPLLLEYSLPATFFITTDFVESQTLLWFDEIALCLWSYEGRLAIPLLGLQMTINGGNRLSISDMIIQKCKSLDPGERRNVLQYIREVCHYNNDSKNRILKRIFDPMTWAQMKEMTQSPLITLGVHTEDHQILTKCSPEVAEGQVFRSKVSVEKILERPVQYFAYPNGEKGDFDEGTKRLLKKLRFQLGFTTVKKLVDLRTDPHEIGRFCISNDLTSYTPFFHLTVSGFPYFLNGLIR
jgi:peptidoglycan/xylan/chitin deacetylase (PgdA/CDA1 family)